MIKLELVKAGVVLVVEVRATKTVLKPELADVGNTIVSLDVVEVM